MDALNIAVQTLNTYRTLQGDREPVSALIDARIDPFRYGQELQADLITTGMKLILWLAPHGSSADNRELVRLKAETAGHAANLIHHLETAVRNLDALHRCAICGNWFVPVRSDQTCCSKPCATALRVRRHRTKQSDYEYVRKLKAVGQRSGKEKKR
ncbi:MAG: hypothetical protein JO189_04615 [Deltaproteobacteria bacterium]|nr:hypothetical protein [Deltaproteobacteria bacterium]